MRKGNGLIAASLALFVGVGLPYVMLIVFMGYTTTLNKFLFFANVVAMMMVVVVAVLLYVRLKDKYDDMVVQ